VLTATGAHARSRRLGSRPDAPVDGSLL